MTDKKTEALKLALGYMDGTLVADHLIDYERKRYVMKGYVMEAIKEALAEQPARQQECNYCGGTGDVSGEYPGVACPECNGSGVQVQPEFIKHEVANTDDWSNWVCPDPNGYLMKCCDCGLVHEAQFGVVRYKSETEREDCDIVNDSNLQAVFRMRRSEQWSPDDTAYRPVGLPMEQPAQQQEPVAYSYTSRITGAQGFSHHPMPRFIDAESWDINPLYTSTPASKPLTEREVELLDGLIDVQLDHALRCDNIGNRTMAEKQKAWDMERVDLLRKLKAAHGIKE